MSAVFFHEIRLLFSGLTAYVYGAFSLFFVAVYMMYYNLSAAYANFEYALAGASFAFILMISHYHHADHCRRKKAEDRSAFIRTAYHNNPDCSGNLYLPTAYGSLFAYIMTGAALLSIGIFISSVTESQAMAAGICFAAMLLNYYMVTLAEYVASSATALLWLS